MGRVGIRGGGVDGLWYDIMGEGSSQIKVCVKCYIARYMQNMLPYVCTPPLALTPDFMILW